MLLPRTENGERKGFLRGHSCCTALVKLSDDWRASLDKKESIGVVAIDFPKPLIQFATICYSLSLKHMECARRLWSLYSLICLTDSNVLDAMGPTRTGCPCAAGFRRVAC